ncbi:Wzz/FepE/Etk N-terminal domain-containing protein [Endozoicomonas numazuensis]|nr:Wzz/FepE/Etk N-terminal domain-containing protein [Endozoicomonas numazuensis]
MNNPLTPNSLYHNHYPDDEIDLFELVEKLFSHKWLILASTLTALFAAALIAFMLPKSFTSVAIINESPEASFAAWNSSTPFIPNQVKGSDKGSQQTDNYLTPDKAYQLYLKYLTSPATSRYAFKQSLLAMPDPETGQPQDKKSLAANYQAFLSNLSISSDKSTKRTQIHYTSDNPEETARVINTIILPYAREQFNQTMQADFSAQVRVQHQKLKTQIEHLESNFVSSNSLRLTELDEALTQARAAGLTELRATEVNATILNGATYLLGEKLLKSRIDVIRNRTEKYRFYSNPKLEEDASKPYIKGVSGRVFELKQLNSLKLDFSAMTPATIEQPALVPVSPTKPNKKLIIALGGILGLMAGVFLALIRIAINNRKERQKIAGHNYPSMTDETIREYNDSDLRPEPAHPDAR